MIYKLGYKVFYKPKSLYFIIKGFSSSFGKNYAHLIREDGSDPIPLRTVLPFSEDYICIPDNAFDALDI